MCTFLQLYKHGSNFEITINSTLKPNKNLFFKPRFVVDSWGEALGGGRGGVGANKVLIKIVYIAHGHVSKFLEGE